MSRESTRDFRSLWFGQSVSLIGDYVSLFTLPTVALLTLHASSLEVGALNAAATIAYPVLGLFVGVWLDRVRLLPTMIACDAARLVIFGSLPVAAAAGRLTLPHLFIVAVLAGACSVVFDIAYQSYVPTLVQGTALAKGNSRMVASDAVAKFVGPAIGSNLLQLLGVVGGLSANALSYLASIGGMARIRTREAGPARSRTAESGPRNTGRQVAEGARFVWRHELLRPLVISASLRNLAMNANRTVLLILMYNALHLSAPTVGVVLTCGAVGSIIGAGFSGRVVRYLGVGRTLLLTLAEGLIWLLAPLTLLINAPAFVLMALMFVSSLWLPIWNATSLTLRQTVTAASFLSRVNATAKTVNLSSIPIGALLGGLAADLVGTADARGLVIVLMACTCGLALVSAAQLATSSIRGLTTYAREPAAQGVN